MKPTDSKKQSNSSAMHPRQTDATPLFAVTVRSDLIDKRVSSVIDKFRRLAATPTTYGSVQT